MENKTAIITGATGAIGKAIAKGMAEKGFFTIVAARNEEKAKATVDELKNITNNSNIIYKLVDVSRKEEIARLAKEIDKPIHVLINNAAATPRTRLETQEGIEMQWATNVLGYFWMIKYFTPHLEAAKQGRVVNVASYYAGGLNLDDPEFKKRIYDNDSAYRQSKQANRMLTYAFAERLKDKGISVNSCHPGDVNSKLSNDLGFGGSTSPAQGAATPVWLATDFVGAVNTGGYFADLQKASCSFSSDKGKIEDLFRLCETY
jgi:NAD(P)-dependent dehydrogenase (short-subunit alcohol dehydrogenase family)